ncbi:MAG: ATP synthase F1 subunit gamma [Clostridiaceae bacterium]|nr:ATP synthase F1 subunit gamma [Eubacteriales bacterium]
MPAITDIKYHIRSVKQTRQITNAMYLISASRMRRAVKRIEQNRAYFERAAETMRDILAHSSSTARHPYVERRAKERGPKKEPQTAFIVIAGNKGLAGSYNHDVLSLAEEHIKAGHVKKIYAVGDMASSTLKKHGFEVDDSFVHMADAPSVAQARRLVSLITALYDAGEINEFHVVYTRFYNSLHRKATDTVLLPVRLFPLMEEAKMPLPEDYEVVYDPSPGAVLGAIVPQLLVGYVYGALVHSNASENSARMTAMESATNSADEMIQTLTVKYNGLRQLNITNELAEIVGGSSAFREKR